MPENKKTKKENIKEANDKSSKKTLSLINKIKLRRPTIIIIAVILLLIVGIFYFKNLFIVAMVNGQPISRLSVINELEKQSGKQIVDSIVVKTLVLQEAKKKNIVISDNEIESEIKKIEQEITNQGGTLDQVLLTRGMTRENLKEQVMLQKIVEKMVGQNVNVTDKEVNDYIENNKDLFPAEAKPEEIKTNVTQQLKQQKMSQEINNLLEKLKKDAKIDYYLNY